MVCLRPPDSSNHANLEKKLHVGWLPGYYTLASESLGGVPRMNNSIIGKDIEALVGTGSKRLVLGANVRSPEPRHVDSRTGPRPGAAWDEHAGCMCNNDIYQQKLLYDHCIVQNPCFVSVFSFRSSRMAVTVLFQVAMKIFCSYNRRGLSHAQGRHVHMRDGAMRCSVTV